MTVGSQEARINSNIKHTNGKKGSSRRISTQCRTARRSERIEEEQEATASLNCQRRKFNEEEEGRGHLSMHERRRSRLRRCRRPRRRYDHSL